MKALVRRGFFYTISIMEDFFCHGKTELLHDGYGRNS
jgi:hypothetical protein